MKLQQCLRGSIKHYFYQKKSLATTVVSPNEPHISIMISYNAAGYKLDPFVIFPSLKNIPDELKDFQAFFSS